MPIPEWLNFRTNLSFYIHLNNNFVLYFATKSRRIKILVYFPLLYAQKYPARRNDLYSSAAKLTFIPITYIYEPNPNLHERAKIKSNEVKGMSLEFSFK